MIHRHVVTGGLGMIAGAVIFWLGCVACLKAPEWRIERKAKEFIQLSAVPASRDTAAEILSGIGSAGLEHFERCLARFDTASRCRAAALMVRAYGVSPQIQSWPQNIVDRAKGMLLAVATDRQLGEDARAEALKTIEKLAPSSNVVILAVEELAENDRSENVRLAAQSVLRWKWWAAPRGGAFRYR